MSKNNIEIGIGKMNKFKTIWVICLLTTVAVLGIFACRKSADVELPDYLSFEVPKGWPMPSYPFQDNPLTEQGFELGKKLFHDKRFSVDNSISCGDCHMQHEGFTHNDHGLAHGVNNQSSTRNPPGLINLAWRNSFNWDGRFNKLDEQPIHPITAPNEMGETMANVLKKLRDDPEYPVLFLQAFGTRNISEASVLKALSQFMLQIVSYNSKYDKVKRGEASFTLSEQLGYEIFQQKCISCHTEPFFTDFSFRNIGMPIDPGLRDLGRMAVTGNKEDSLLFMVPSLRNVQLTFPYGHDGRFPTLINVFDHYSNRVVQAPGTDPLVRNRISLTPFEMGQLQSFLFTLTDSTVLQNPRLRHH